MRQQFVPDGESARADESFAEADWQALALCPWAAEAVACAGGWRVFESVGDAERWRRQG
jgi:hypothetical protein